MATTGPKLTVPHTVGASAIVGQGNQPELWALYTTDTASTPSPVWLDASTKVRSWSVSRGRSSELAAVDTGTASLVLDNRTRTFDPINNANIRPLNRIWLREQFTGETQDLFKGFAESYDQQWSTSDAGKKEAVAVVNAADEFKLMGLDGLPTTSPPRTSYTEVVHFDQPAGFWELTEPPEFRVFAAAPPPELPAPTPANPQPAGPTLDPNLVFGDEWGWF